MSAQREICPWCEKEVGVRKIKGGDGSYVRLNWHREQVDPDLPIVPHACQGRFHEVPVGGDS